MEKAPDADLSAHFLLSRRMLLISGNFRWSVTMGEAPLLGEQFSYRLIVCIVLDPQGHEHISKLWWH